MTIHVRSASRLSVEVDQDPLAQWFPVCLARVDLVIFDFLIYSLRANSSLSDFPSCWVHVDSVILGSLHVGYSNC